MFNVGRSMSESSLTWTFILYSEKWLKLEPSQKTITILSNMKKIAKS